MFQVSFSTKTDQEIDIDYCLSLFSEVSEGAEEIIKELDATQKGSSNYTQKCQKLLKFKTDSEETLKKCFTSKLQLPYANSEQVFSGSVQGYNKYSKCHETLTPLKEKTPGKEHGSGKLGEKGKKSDGTGREQSIKGDKTELEPISGSKGKEQSKAGQPENSKHETLGEQGGGALENSQKTPLTNAEDSGSQTSDIGGSFASIHSTDKNTMVVVPPLNQVAARESRTHSSDSSTQGSCLEPVRKSTYPPRNPEDTNSLNSYSSVSIISNGDHNISLTTLQKASFTGTSDGKNDDPVSKAEDNHVTGASSEEIPSGKLLLSAKPTPDRHQSPDEKVLQNEVSISNGPSLLGEKSRTFIESQSSGPQLASLNGESREHGSLASEQSPAENSHPLQGVPFVKRPSPEEDRDSQGVPQNKPPEGIQSTKRQFDSRSYTSSVSSHTIQGQSSPEQQSELIMGNAQQRKSDINGNADNFHAEKTFPTEAKNEENLIKKYIIIGVVILAVTLLFVLLFKYACLSGYFSKKKKDKRKRIQEELDRMMYSHSIFEEENIYLSYAP
ncbi:PIR Superfamily Protein [Plasmodium ovale wallikeri]|uniref:PIR Superfamily Protein n=2 Tax=Plasmodium ovale TaxID=36330 RepID=A0A1A8YNJ3_PLAOA|nr:PIR Superfamily Protein [Plasmodium ovale wallikeri]SBT58912.1 PIR Superfamily Protein [Plasmodium ovale wallikeri]SBT73693.1 hypothetical protein POWCR01_000143600 [Plasmodium ovale]